LHAEVERRPFDSQSRGGAFWTGDNPPGLLKNFANVVSLRVFQGNSLQRSVSAAALSDEGPENEALANVRPISNLSSPTDDGNIDPVAFLC